MQNTFTCQAQDRIRFGAEQQGNKIVHTDGQRADHITLAEDSNRINLIELLAGGMCVNFCCL